MLHEPALLLIERRSVPGTRIGGSVLGATRRRDQNVDPSVGQSPAQKRLCPTLAAELAKDVVRNLLSLQPVAGAAERPHRNHPEVELLGERQDPPLDLAFLRVVRHLDGVKAVCAHHPFQLVERRRRIVGSADEADAAAVMLSLEPPQALLPGDEVVDLLEIHPPAEEAELVGKLAMSLVGRRRPDLRGDDGVVSKRPQCLPQDLFRTAVHGGRVDQPAAACKCCLDDGAGVRNAFLADVEDLPGPEADDGHLPAALSEPTPLHREPAWYVPGVAGGRLLEAPELTLAQIDERASGENFSVASLLAPKDARPHLRAIYGFARLVDNLGDEAQGDRSALLDELEAELDACYGGEPRTALMRRLQATILACELPREPFSRLIEANRIDQRTSRYETWDDVRDYCTYSAEPVGRLVLGIYGRDSEADLTAASDDVCTGLQLVNFLQDPPRDLALGRVYLPQEDLRRFGVDNEELAGPVSDRLTALCRFESARAAALLRPGFGLAEALGGRIGKSVALFSRGGLAALAALERAEWDVFSGRPAPGRLTFAWLTARELIRR